MMRPLHAVRVCGPLWITFVTIGCGAAASDPALEPPSSREAIQRTGGPADPGNGPEAPARTPSTSETPEFIERFETPRPVPLDRLMELPPAAREPSGAVTDRRPDAGPSAPAATRWFELHTTSRSTEAGSRVQTRTEGSASTEIHPNASLRAGVAVDAESGARDVSPQIGIELRY